MVIEYAGNHEEKVCNNRNEALKEFGNKKIVTRLEMLMLDLHNTKHFAEFYTNPMFKSYRAHELQGNKKGIISLSIDYSYRMTLTVEVRIVEDKIIILEVNKHYGE